MVEEQSVDLLYLACNRLEYTRETFTTLMANTDWDYVKELFVYDDGSVDGTHAWLRDRVAGVPCRARLVSTNHGSPVTAMADFIQSASAPILAKTDNDAMLPPGWLRQSLEVMGRHPELSLLGIEAMYPHVDDPGLARSYTEAPFISGLGLYRREAFAASTPYAYDRWFGFEEWQSAQSSLIRGWIMPAMPVFLLDRLPFEPWSTLCRDYVGRGWQREWPKYDGNSSVWRWRWPANVETKVEASSDIRRFLTVMRIKNEASHIAEVLGRALSFSGRALVFDDNSTDQTREICRSFGDCVTLILSPFQGLDEARDKNYLIKRIVEAGPEWVLWIDGDEALEPAGPAKLVRAAQEAGSTAVFSLKIAYLWNDPYHIRVDGIFGQFRRPSFFRLKGQPANQLVFPTTGYGANLHCGNVPRGIVGGTSDLDLYLKHYGYITPDQRRAKYEWYTAIDPGNGVEDNYRHLAEIPGARFAPGPPRVIPWRD